MIPDIVPWEQLVFVNGYVVRPNFFGPLQYHKSLLRDIV